MSVSHSVNNFESILSSDLETQRNCLEKLVEDLNEIKEKTIYNFLNDSGSEDFLWSLVKLLASDDKRLASNAAYVIGSFAETELGAERVLSITKGRKSSFMIRDLTTMLTSDDAETVMNAAGTLGTLAETNKGRSWMLMQECIDETISKITDLLSYENSWVASNAALVLARITISEDGCLQILSHNESNHVLTKLIHSLGNDAAGRGMNSAFAIGRLLDLKSGKERLLNLPETEKMILTLCRMLCKGDMGSAKNSCFAVSCLAADKDGNQRVISNSMFNEVLSRLLLLLSNEEDVEAAWFAAMTLRTLSSQQRGILRLRDNEAVLTALNKNLNKPVNTKELNEEISKTLEQLKKLEAPPPPTVTLLNDSTIRVRWEEVTLKNEGSVIYKLYEGSRLVYKGKSTQVEFEDSKPNTSYSYKLKISALGDDSPFSTAVAIATDEGTPSPPCNLKVIGITSSQIRVSWSTPEQPNGALKGYNIYLGDKLLQQTSETSFIATKLQPSTSYTIHVRAITNKGVGEAASIECRTHELGAHAPSKPTVTVIGRNEVHVTWNPPAVPLGRISRYELTANKDVIYSGTDRSYHVTNLIPDKDYSFTVCAITSEGRCESEVTKKKTPKDKSQTEPGRHASKTHSFKAKEFHLEKSKTQSSISVSKPKSKTKKQHNLPARPSSCSSTPSHPSSPSSHHTKQDGSWGALHSGSDQHSTGTNGSDKLKNHHPEMKQHLSAVLGGNMMKVDVHVPILSNGIGGQSMFSSTSHSDLQHCLKFTEKSAAGQSRYSIEPISWNEMLSNEPSPLPAGHVTKKAVTTKIKTKSSSNKLEVHESQKSFINLVHQNKGQRSTLPRIEFMNRNKKGRVPAVSANHGQPKEYRGTRLKRRTVRKSPTSDSSSDDSSIRPTPPARVSETSRKLEPLTMGDVIAQNRLSAKISNNDRNFHFDEAKNIVERLKSPSRGYWSDSETGFNSRKKENEANPNHYGKFNKVHRPSKALLGKSPMVSEQWFSEASLSGKKYFFPTQIRTQRSHLPKSVLQDRRFDIFFPEDFQQSSLKGIAKQRHSSYRHVTEQIPIRSTLSKTAKSNTMNRVSVKSSKVVSSYPTQTKTTVPDANTFLHRATVAPSNGDPV